ncbi:Hypothetical predicted protein [Paramuricea clavata]|uniref:Uncharacterized protein n=1 Tax=Paramuricea clavata TaxID=317549 RepID=A0A6S7JYV9_PARCT|nr:Hypothetical predicted protein [Paramuricea clavata]
MQSRNADLEEFFSHEVQPFPPSLSEFGNLRLPSAKSELLKCLIPSTQAEPPTQFDCSVLDGAVVVHCLPVTGSNTFDDYAHNVFIPHLSRQRSTRVDVVWDTYIPNSLKESTREKRGKGVRRKVDGGTKLPSNWVSFLRDPLNKEELFHFLSLKVARHNWPERKTIHVTSGTSVISIGSATAMTDCTHEEADTRIVVHILHAIQVEEAKTVLVRTVDTDVLVILVGKLHDPKEVQPELDLWLAFGMGRNFRFISVNCICAILGKPQSTSLPVFHALTGCDTTSGFFGKGKKSAWQAWEIFPEVTPTFEMLAKTPFMQLTTDSPLFKQIERYTVIMYDKLSPLSDINLTRMELFCKNGRTMDKLPPTQDALLQHVRRAVFQAGIWTVGDQPQPHVPSPGQFSWSEDDGKWVPKWITILEVSKACSELIKCSCKGACTRCKCAKASLVLMNISAKFGAFVTSVTIRPILSHKRPDYSKLHLNPKGSAATNFIRFLKGEQHVSPRRPRRSSTEDFHTIANQLLMTLLAGTSRTLR